MELTDLCRVISGVPAPSRASSPFVVRRAAVEEHSLPAALPARYARYHNYVLGGIRNRTKQYFSSTSIQVRRPVYASTVILIVLASTPSDRASRRFASAMVSG